MFAFDYRPPEVVAEIGCNHMGSLDIAKELIELARLSGVQHVKFQKRTVRELLSPDEYAAPHPNPRNSFGDSYGEHREFLEFDQAQHAELQQFCRENGLDYSTSVWDVTAAREIAALAPTGIKVPSACNNDLELLEVLRDEYDGMVHVSFGMTTHAEERRVVELFEGKGQARDRLHVYACTSGYPVPFEDVALLEINRLYEAYGDRVHSVCFSGHHLGIAVDVAAYALGARWIERHFTKDRTWKGTDHAASLEPTGLQKLVRDLHATHKALTRKDTEILEIEQEQREKLKHVAAPTVTS
ncbi:MAG: N-acetylneuraminate synthase family protein [Planctomycetes bacterium]|nr:N-acetylneuraminate synthase family protein [Planctomycetota bacterium]